MQISHKVMPRRFHPRIPGGCDTVPRAGRHGLDTLLCTMVSLRRPRTHTRWVTLALLVLALLAPTVMRASTDRSPWTDVCTTATKVADAQTSHGSPAASAHEHCDACFSRLDSAGPAPSPLSLALAAPLAQAVPRLFLIAPRPLFAWRGSQPRAPPAV